MSNGKLIAWGIKWKTGTILSFSIRLTKREAIREIAVSNKKPWKDLRKEGMVAVKLEIREFKKSKYPQGKVDPTQTFPQLDLFDSPSG